jgi:hypothetical protein
MCYPVRARIPEKRKTDEVATGFARHHRGEGAASYITDQRPHLPYVELGQQIIQPRRSAMVNVTVSHPFYQYDDNDHTALVAAVSLIFALLTVTSIVAKLVVRRGKIALQFFDYILFVGAAVLIVETALIVAATKEGLGLHSDVDTINKDKIRKVNARPRSEDR